MGLLDLKNALKKIDDSIKKKADPPQVPPKRAELKQSRQQQPFSTGKSNERSTSFNIDDIFDDSIADGEPPVIFKRTKHRVVPQGCACGDEDDAIHTNNFYNNLTLEDQTFPVWTLPYSLWFSKDLGQDVGLAFNHTEASQRVYGPEADADPAQFYFNPPKIKSLVISGEGFRDYRTSVTLEGHNKLSVVAKVVWEEDKYISVPLAHGMGFVTATYNNIKPVIASQVGIQEFSRVENVGSLSKYKIKLFNQVVWSVYIDGDVILQLEDPNHIKGDKVTNATIQFARGESLAYDDTAGTYPVGVNLLGNVHGEKAQYSFEYKMQGCSRSGSGLVWCLPHHQEALVSTLQNKYSQLELDSPTKGVMRAYVTNVLTMEEQLPLGINWDPWASFSTDTPSYSPIVKDLIKAAAIEEIKQDVVGMANIDSMYTSGKILDKFAYIAYVCKFILEDDELTARILPRVKEAVELFANNRQKYPLVYDTTWKGLISSADPAADFGNSNYNDHHFHYGYHIHAIALVAKIDSQWLTSNNNLVLNYANTLLRDTANPKKDKYFPQFRSFDWFHGHSFAHGIFASGDGKDEESSSEDYHFVYGMKLYAKVVGNDKMESRANLMLAIMRRAMNMYMLYSDDNKIQPKNFIRNKVAGISFENKIDFATYFGRGTIADEWIHGIHMLPITPISSYIRQEQFVREEWDQKLAKIIDRIPDGWKGILMLNLALFNPKKAWNWFARNDWDDRLIDNGMSRTWSLAYIAGIGGAD